MATICRGLKLPLFRRYLWWGCGLLSSRITFTCGTNLQFDACAPRTLQHTWQTVRIFNKCCLDVAFLAAKQVSLWNCFMYYQFPKDNRYIGTQLSLLCQSWLELKGTSEGGGFLDIWMSSMRCRNPLEHFLEIDHSFEGKTFINANNCHHYIPKLVFYFANFNVKFSFL